MDLNNTYSPEAIETMKAKLSLYKEMLHSIKTGTIADDYLLMKQESDGFHHKFEGVMKRMEEYHYSADQRTNQLAAQLQSVNDTVSTLKRDIDFIKEKMDRLQVHDLMEKMNRVIEVQERSKQQDESGEVSRLKEELRQLKEQQHRQKETESSEVKRLKEELASLKNQQVPSKQTETSEVDRLKEELDGLREQLVHSRQQVPEMPIEEPREQAPAPKKTSEYRKLQSMLQSSRKYHTGRSDYYPPMSQPGYQQQSSYYQNQQGFQQNGISFPESGNNKPGKRRMPGHSAMDFNQNTIIRKKNGEETAQRLEENRKPEKVQKTVTKNPEPLEKVSNQKALSIKETLPHKEADDKPKMASFRIANRPKSLPARGRKVESFTQENDEDAPKKRERASIFSFFQRRL
ncbi:hypothetical protein [Halobacillus sp. KGW1]|uniref:hypothetical protein n=1 Tax=Halobacillus sp. KGW1 TaxID=1793726 RepID=UPI0007803F22|nr:hypothetical protein [Halobacillus sp. KGW1]